MKHLDDLLKKTDNTKTQASNNLANKINQFDVADKVMNQINSTHSIDNNVKDKMEYVTYALPKSFIYIIGNIIKKCMKKEQAVNKSEIIRLGIQMVNELSTDELIKRLDSVRVERGRPKN